MDKAQVESLWKELRELSPRQRTAVTALVSKPTIRPIDAFIAISLEPPSPTAPVTLRLVKSR